MASPNGHSIELVDGNRQLEEASTPPSSVAPPEAMPAPEFSTPDTEQTGSAGASDNPIAPPETFSLESSGS